MVETVPTSVQVPSAAPAARPAPRAEAASRVNPPDAPARERPVAQPTATPLSTVVETPFAAESGEAPRAAAVPSRGSITPLIGNSGLTTYRDQESGRVVVRIFDRESGDVLLEFPPEGQRLTPTNLDPPGSDAPRGDVEA